MEREPINSEGVSPKIAFFLVTIARNPEMHLKVKSEKITPQGESYFTEVLNREMKPLLEKIKKNKTLIQMAEEYLESIQPRLGGGTDIISLRDDNAYDKTFFFAFLVRNDCHLNTFMKDIISLDLII